jgi:type IV pilus assembly protein PilE
MIKLTQSMKTQSGFTLIELMIVVVIVSVLASIAIPSYQQYIVDARRSMAQQEMLVVASRQEQFMQDNKTYASELALLGYGASAIGFDAGGQRVLGTDASAQYVVQTAALTTSASGVITEYTVVATPKGTQLKRDAACGTLQLDTSGEKSASGTDADDCW